MNVFFGVLSLLAAALLALHFRPRQAESRFLCLFTALTGVISLLAGQPISFLYGLIMAALQAIVGVCCWLRLRAERRSRAQRRTPPSQAASVLHAGRRAEDGRLKRHNSS